MSTRYASSTFRLWCCLVMVLVAAVPSWGQTVAQTADKARQNYARTEQNLKHLTRRKLTVRLLDRGRQLVAYFQRCRCANCGAISTESWPRDGRILLRRRSLVLVFVQNCATTNLDCHRSKPARQICDARAKRSYFARGKLVRWVIKRQNSPCRSGIHSAERETLRKRAFC
jgi:hypothetical protein